MASRIEVLRQQHEDIEYFKQLAAVALQSRSDPTNPHKRLVALSFPLKNARGAEQLATDLISSARSRAEKLHSHYTSNESLVQPHADPTSAFYAALRELRDIHRSSVESNFASISGHERDRALLAAFQPTQFSGEEGGGRFFDLQPFFHKYVNLVKDPTIHYYQYVRDKLTVTEEVQPSLRSSRQYEQYLESLVSYLRSFARKAHPLDDVDRHVEKAIKEARVSLEEELGKITEKNETTTQLSQSLGEKEIKLTLQRFALKCGGRPDDRVKRLWEASKKREYGGAALLERLLGFLINQLLYEEKSATVANIEKKLSLSYEEIESERNAEELSTYTIHENDDTEKVESTIYNPKDVPLGWDGKPIPYWMYKLHGLNHEFKCEICGGAIYKGPRVFERHFTETAHVGGLKRLGISYTKAFMMITRIQDAIQLHERLTNREKNVQFDTEREVEVEDGKGNVMNLKTFHDLKRQGLL